jgi:acyl-CoA reductase-like NAD-dependent aldehyde dehydrogenase
VGRGSNPYPAIVCADADLQGTAQLITAAAFKNNFDVKVHWAIVDKAIYVDFLEALTARYALTIFTVIVFAFTTAMIHS